MMPKVPPPKIEMIKVRHFWPYRLGSEGRGYYENRDEERVKGRREELLAERGLQQKLLLRQQQELQLELKLAENQMLEEALLDERMASYESQQQKEKERRAPRPLWELKQARAAGRGR